MNIVHTISLQQQQKETLVRPIFMCLVQSPKRIHAIGYYEADIAKLNVAYTYFSSQCFITAILASKSVHFYHN